MTVTRPRIQQYIYKYAQTIELSDIVYFGALDMAQDLEDRPFFISGKSSSGLAAAVIWLSCILGKQRMTQRSLSMVICEDTCRVAAVTISSLYKKIVKELTLPIEVPESLPTEQQFMDKYPIYNRPIWPMEEPLPPIGRVQCPICGRSYNERYPSRYVWCIYCREPVLKQ
jgi:hypothetical protein